MIPYEEAVYRIQEEARRFLKSSYSLEKLIQDALYDTTVQDIKATQAYPKFRNSAMDGYAIHTSWEGNVFPIRKDAMFAGDLDQDQDLDRNNPKIHHAMYITTGAVVPKAYNAVIPIEHCHVEHYPVGHHSVGLVGLGSEDYQILTIDPKDKKLGLHIRPQGSDFKEGDILLPAGSTITPHAMMILATSGIKKVFVKKPLRVVLFSTGNEITTGAIYDSNRQYLKAQLKEFPIELVAFHIIPDEKEALEELFMQYSNHVHMIISTGAVSKGDRDYIPIVAKKIINEIGGGEIFHGVAVRPGKPQYFAKLGETLLFGLPGNPISVAVGYAFFIKEFLNTFYHRNFLYFRLPLAHNHEVSKAGFTFFLKAFINSKQKVCVLKNQESYKVGVLIQANAWIMLPPSQTSFPMDALVTCFPIPEIYQYNEKKL